MAVVRRTGGIAVSVDIDAPSFRRFQRRLGKMRITRYQEQYLTGMRGVIRKHMRAAVKKSFPKISTASPLYRSITTHLDRGSARLTVGWQPAGHTDSLTGRPLSEYFVPIQSYPGGPTRTRPPRLSPEAKRRIVAWAVEQGLPRTTGWAIAASIQRQGTRRKPLQSLVFSMQGPAARRGLLVAFRPSLHADLRAIRDSVLAAIVADATRGA